MNTLLFPFAEYWWFYLAFALLVFLLLAADLGIVHRRAHEVGFWEATRWTAVWAALALLFCLGLYGCAGSKFGPAVSKQIVLEFLTGYVVEWSLSLDNMFVFLVVFEYFGIPNRLQHRILFYGILGALAFRGIFIALGSVLLQYAWMAIVFGLFLMLTGIRMLISPGRQVDLTRSPVIRLLRKLLPVSSGQEEEYFFHPAQGRLWATPLLLALAFIEITDIIFAIDSVPAIFAITQEPFIVFTSNVFAILGLRSMYFLLAGAVGRFHLLRYGLAVILMFVGLKMAWLNQLWQGHFPIGVSLAFIGGILALSVGLSLAFPKKLGGRCPSGHEKSTLEG